MDIRAGWVRAWLGSCALDFRAVGVGPFRYVWRKSVEFGRYRSHRFLPMHICLCRCVSQKIPLVIQRTEAASALVDLADSNASFHTLAVEHIRTLPRLSMLPSPNQSVERTGMSRSRQGQLQRPWRLIPVAHLGR